jgi:hypothetical protein
MHRRVIYYTSLCLSFVVFFISVICFTLRRKTNALTLYDRAVNHLLCDRHVKY